MRHLQALDAAAQAAGGRLAAGNGGDGGAVFTVWLRAVDADPVMPEPAGDSIGNAVTAIAAVAAAVTHRFALPTVPLAVAAVAISGGRLLAPGWPQGRVQHELTLPLGPMRP